MKPKKINPRVELVSLLRGFFSLPVIISLSRFGIIEKILKKKKSVYDFKNVKNKEFLNSIFKYLCSLGILKLENKNKKNQKFLTTKLGKKILVRKGSFHLLNSYGPFINNIDKLLTSSSNKNISCDRKENVIGSGLTNGRKFFPKCFEFFKKNDFDIVADIGCGDGDYLSRSIKYFSNSDFFASDVSSKAIFQCRKNLSSNYPKKKITYFRSDASNANKWCTKLNKLKLKKNSKILITFWYVIHEISENNKYKVINFFKKIKKICPNADIVIGEIVKIDETTLFANKEFSILPEFLFFHEISGQGVLSIKDLNFIKSKIPYKLINYHEFDHVYQNKKKIPSAIIWHLRPNK